MNAQAPVITTSNLKVHVALNTEKMEESVAFYRAFFGSEPVKHKPGYAKFELEEPALNFTLNQGKVPASGALNHLGVQVASTEDVLRAAQRLEQAGLKIREENNTDCCYALQDKVWVHDPNGYAWEVFVVKVGDTQPGLNVEQGSASHCEADACAC